MTYMFPRTLSLVVVVGLAALCTAPGCKMINSLSGNSTEQAAADAAPAADPAAAAAAAAAAAPAAEGKRPRGEAKRTKGGGGKVKS